MSKKKLAELDEPVFPSASTLTLAERLFYIMSECKSMHKAGKNAVQNYDYVRETDVSDAIRDLLVKYRVLALPSLEEEKITNFTTKNNVPQNLVSILVKYKFINVDNPTDVYEIKMAGHGADSSDKGIYKASTGCHKYTMLRAFCLGTDEDPENDRGEDNGNKKPVPPPKRPTQPKVDITQFVNDAIAAGNLRVLGEVTIGSHCSKQGHTIKSIYSAEPIWVAKVLTDPSISKKLTEGERQALIHYGKYLETTKE